MKKAILNKKVQVLHKLILCEASEPTVVMPTFISREQLQNLYKNMAVISNGRVVLKNISNMPDYNRLSFFYESIIHDYSKKFNMFEDQFKIFVLECNSLHELKDAVGYYEYKNKYGSWAEQQDVGSRTYPEVSYEDTPNKLVGFRGSF